MIEQLRKNQVKFLSIFLLTVGVLYIGLLLLPINVLKGWHISTDKSSYTVGDKITLKTVVTKARPSDGHSIRSLVCKSDGSTSEYTINTSPASGVPGFRTTYRDFRASDSINNLPVTCQVKTTAHYWIWYIKPVKQSTYSNWFTINDIQTVIPSNSVATNPLVEVYIPPNVPAPHVTPEQVAATGETPVTVQPTPAPTTTEAPQKGLLGKVGDLTKSIINKL